MPNSGVFYSGGKFHISKLSTDLVAFAGQVETGIVLADNQGTGQGNRSIVLPTAAQVIITYKTCLTMRLPTLWMVVLLVLLVQNVFLYQVTQILKSVLTICSLSSLISSAAYLLLKVVTM